MVVFSRKSVMQNGDNLRRFFRCALILCRAAKILSEEASLEKSINSNSGCMYYIESGSRVMSYKQ